MAGERVASRKLALERLDHRRLLTGDVPGIFIYGDVIEIVGTKFNDNVGVTLVQEELQVVASNDQGPPQFLYIPKNFVGSVKRILFHGEDGNDSFSNATGIPCTVKGGDGEDTISGGSGNDELSGGPGDDTVRGNGGDDIITGDADTTRNGWKDGNDELQGGDGIDQIWGQRGHDRIFGGADNDIIDAGPGHDYLSGFDGIDKMKGVFGRDKIVGGEDIDHIFGGSGSDYLDGGADDDVMEGQGDHDCMFGRSGGDIMNGGFGNDYLATGVIGEVDTARGNRGENDLFGEKKRDTLEQGRKYEGSGDLHFTDEGHCSLKEFNKIWHKYNAYQRPEDFVAVNHISDDADRFVQIAVLAEKDVAPKHLQHHDRTFLDQLPVEPGSEGVKLDAAKDTTKTYTRKLVRPKGADSSPGVDHTKHDQTLIVKPDGSRIEVTITFEVKHEKKKTKQGDEYVAATQTVRTTTTRKTSKDGNTTTMTRRQESEVEFDPPDFDNRPVRKGETRKATKITITKPDGTTETYIESEDFKERWLILRTDKDGNVLFPKPEDPAGGVIEPIIEAEYSDLYAGLTDHEFGFVLRASQDLRIVTLPSDRQSVSPYGYQDDALDRQIMDTPGYGQISNIHLHVKELKSELNRIEDELDSLGYSLARIVRFGREPMDWATEERVHQVLYDRLENTRLQLGYLDRELMQAFHELNQHNPTEPQKQHLQFIESLNAMLGETADSDKTALVMQMALESSQDPLDHNLLNSLYFATNDAPQAMTLMPYGLGEPLAAGRFRTVDSNYLDQFSYQLVAGEGDQDNSMFQIVDDQLIAVSLAADCKTSLNIRVRSEDSAGAGLEQMFTILVLDPFLKEDVNKDSFVTPVDALHIFNHLNQSSGGDVEYLANLDVNRDQFVSPIDGLLVVNFLNQTHTLHDVSADAETPVTLGEITYWTGAGSEASLLPSETIYRQVDEGVFEHASRSGGGDQMQKHSARATPAQADGSSSEQADGNEAPDDVDSDPLRQSVKKTRNSL